MRRPIKLAMAVLIAGTGAGVALANWAGNYREIVGTIDPSAFNLYDAATGTTGLDRFSVQFADYRGDLTNPFTDNTRTTGFSMPTNDVRLAEWLNSMTASYNSPAPEGWATFEVVAAASWKANAPTKDAAHFGTLVTWRAP